MPIVRARIDLGRVAQHAIFPSNITPPRVEKVEDTLRDRGLTHGPDGWWTGDETIIQSLGDAVIERDPANQSCPPTAG